LSSELALQLGELGFDRSFVQLASLGCLLKLGVEIHAGPVAAPGGKVTPCAFNRFGGAGALAACRGAILRHQLVKLPLGERQLVALDGQFPLQHFTASLMPGCESLGHVHGFLIPDPSRVIPAPDRVGMLGPLGCELLFGAHECVSHHAQSGTHLDYRIPKRPAALGGRFGKEALQAGLESVEC
jgi:hypothetical protein